MAKTARALLCLGGAELESGGCLLIDISDTSQGEASICDLLAHLYGFWQDMHVLKM